jgi:YHS domain-containing protein
MKSKMKQFNAVFLTVILLLVGLTVLGSCKKSEPPAPTKIEEVISAEIEQTMCPVMDEMKIDKNVFVEYKGKKVYFCCAGCKGKFEVDPEKYVANLPQFKN